MQAARSAAIAEGASPDASRTVPRAYVSERRQHLGAHRGRERRELVGELTRPGGVAGRQPHLDRGREEPGPRRPGPMLVEHPTSGAHRAVDVALRQPQQREAGDGVVPVPARLAVRLGGGIELAAQAVQLAALVVGEAERGVEGVGQSLARQLGFGGRIGPRPLCEEHL